MRVRYILLILLLACSAFAQTEAEIKEKIDSVVSYAEQYERGQITYLQMIAHTEFIREQVNELMGEGLVEVRIGAEVHQGLSEEAVRRILGPPAEWTTWTWIINKEQPGHLEAPVPRWERTIFDGKKMKVMLDCHPHTVEYPDGTRFTYYWMSIDPRFKAVYEFDLPAILDDVSASAHSYKKSGTGGRQLAEKIVSYQRILRGYLQQNRESCDHIMQQWFSQDEMMGEQSRLRIETNLYTGKQVTLRADLHTCDGCEWPWVNIWFWAEGQMEREKGGLEEIDRELYDEMSIEGLNAEMERKLDEVVREARNYDRRPDPRFATLLAQNRAEIEVINQVLDEKHYQREETRQENYGLRMDHMRGLLGKYGELSSEPFTQIRYEKPLVENKVERRDSWCRSIGEVRCGGNEGCRDGTCVPAYGGNEICNNEIDDDNDAWKDCDDPDCTADDFCLCARHDFCGHEPHRYCQIVSMEPQLGTDIQAARAAKSGGYLYVEMFVDGNINMENVRYKFNVWDDTAQMWRDFYFFNYTIEGRTERGEFDTSQVKWSYGNALRMKAPLDMFGGEDHRLFVNPATLEVETWSEYDRILEGVDPVEAEAGDLFENPGLWHNYPVYQDMAGDSLMKGATCWCEEGWGDHDGIGENGCETPVSILLCGNNQHKDEEIAECTCNDDWYDCDEADGCESHLQCTNDTYICNGAPSAEPCQANVTGYNCAGRIYTIPCSQVPDLCGEHQHYDEEQNSCRCKQPYSDCDDDGICETRGACEQDAEVCDDKVDNNDNGLVDCEDLRHCSGGAVCGIADDGSEMRCISSMCGAPPDTCTSDPGCPPGSVCRNSKCVPGEICDDQADNDWDGLADCADPDCPEKTPCSLKDGQQLFCTSGICILPVAKCTIDDDCPAGICQNERCVPPECGANADCGKGEVCDGGRCAARAECDSDDECGEGEGCKDGACVEAPECDVDGDCGESMVCDGRKCVAPPECKADDDCSEGICQAEKCADPECEEDEECGGGKVCYGGRCIEKPPGCLLDEECAEGEACIDGICRPEKVGCISDQDCAPGAVCEGWACVILPAPEFEVCNDEVDNDFDGLADCADVGGCPEGAACASGTCSEGICKEKVALPPDATGNRCTLVTDCGENEMCSSGMCKIILLPVLPKPPEPIPPEEVPPEEKPPEEKPPEEFPPAEGLPPEPAPLPPLREVPPAEAAPLPVVEPVPEIPPEPVPEEEPAPAPEPEMPAEPAPSPSQPPPEPEAIEGATGGPTGEVTLLFTPTGLAVSGCASKQDCGPSSNCDPFNGECHCNDYYFNCDKDWSNGCESQDSTCGGRVDPCAEEKCPANMFCDPARGHCVCPDGLQDCDGDWLNGCESQEECHGCESNFDCAQPRCADWGGAVIHKFGCVEGESWVDRTGAVQFAGQCEHKPTGGIEAWTDFDAWGEPFEQVNDMKRQVEAELGEDWCTWELKNTRRKRFEIENSINQDFFKWFFEDYIHRDPAEWDKHISGIWGTYWQIVNTNRETVERLQCLGEKQFPADYTPIDVSYESEYGRVHIWEEMKATDYFGEQREILSPYMKVWVFPPKEFLKAEMKGSMEKGVMPGPEGERPGPSPEEIERIRADPLAMRAIQKISSRFGGSAEMLFVIRDGDEVVMRMLLQINPDVIFSMEPVTEYNGKPDVVMEASFDYVYSIIQTMERDMRGDETEYPPWDRPPAWSRFKRVGDGAKLFGKISRGVATGQIKVTPRSAYPKLAASMGDLMSVMGRHKGEGKE